MGTYVGTPPDEFVEDDGASTEQRRREPLGDALAGLFSEVEVDSVDAVRETRER